jgi:hypothetical protein
MKGHEMITLDKINIGDKITVASWLGGHIVGIVTGTDPDIKNGRPGADYLVSDPDHPSRWCYLDQIVCVG